MSELSGRELDAAVAEGVMGWEFISPTRSGNRQYRNADGDMILVGESALISTWKPSESIEAAMQVVEKMREREWFVEIANTPTGWFVNFIYDVNERIDCPAVAQLLPEAICKAALTALSEAQK